MILVDGGMKDNLFGMGEGMCSLRGFGVSSLRFLGWISSVCVSTEVLLIAPFDVFGVSPFARLGLLTNGLSSLGQVGGRKLKVLLLRENGLAPGCSVFAVLVLRVTLLLGGSLAGQGSAKGF